METTSVRHTTPTSDIYVAAEQSPSDELPHGRQRRTPSVALIDFEGNAKIVRANSVKRHIVNRQCLSFFFHCAALLIAMLTGITMMIVRGMTSPDFSIWSSIFALGVGGFLPQPNAPIIAGLASDEPLQRVVVDA